MNPKSGGTVPPIQKVRVWAPVPAVSYAYANQYVYKTKVGGIFTARQHSLLCSAMQSAVLAMTDSV